MSSAIKLRLRSARSQSRFAKQLFEVLGLTLIRPQKYFLACCRIDVPCCQRVPRRQMKIVRRNSHSRLRSIEEWQVILKQGAELAQDALRVLARHGCDGLAVPVCFAGDQVQRLPALIAGNRCMWVSDKRSEEHTSELQSLRHLVCRLLLEKKKKKTKRHKTAIKDTTRTSD